MFSGAVFDYAIPRSTHSRYPAGSEIGFQDVPILCLVLLDRDFRVYNDKDGRTKINIAPFDETAFHQHHPRGTVFFNYPLMCVESESRATTATLI
jgi:hypothetical protein